LARIAPPLLRATDAFSYSRKGPFALYALSQYIGKDRVDDALRSLLKRHGSGVPPLPTSLALYRELQAVTPDSYQSMAPRPFREEHDLGIRDRAGHGATDRGRSLAGDARRARAQDKFLNQHNND